MRSLLALLLLAVPAFGKEIPIEDWITPPTPDYFPDQDADVGDTIIFTWPENFITDVHIYPNGNCTADGTLVGYESGASYTFLPEDAGTEVFFANSVGRRCEDGHHIVVKVSANAQISSVEGVNSAANKNGFVWALALIAGLAAKLIL